MKQSMVIQYSNAKFLLAADDSITFHDFDITPHALSYLPHYCKGLLFIDNSSCVVIHFADFIGTSLVDDMNYENILLKISNDNGDFGFIMPMPRFFDTEIPSEQSSSITSGQEASFTIKIPVVEYVLFNDEIHARLLVEDLTSFIKNEIALSVEKGWRENFNNWTLLDKEQILPEIRSKVYSAKKSANENIYLKEMENFYIVKIHATKIAIKGKDIFEIIPIPKNLSNLPNSKEWIVGLLEYKQEGILLLDLNKWLQIANDEPFYSYVIIIDSDKSKVGILSDKIVSINSDEIGLKMRNIDIQNPLTLFLNVFQVGDEFVFQLNPDILQNAIEGLIPPQNWLHWVDLLTSELVRKEIEYKVFDETFYALMTEMGEDKLFIESSTIEFIRSSDDVERVIYKGVTFSAYKNMWIPSVNIHESLYDDEVKENFEISIILKQNESYVEFLVKNANLTDYDIELFSFDQWKRLAGSNNLLGLKAIANSPKGDLGWIINPAVMTRSLVGNDEYWESPSDFLSGKSLPQVQQEEEKFESYEGIMMSLFNDDIVIYLLIDDTDQGKKYAFQADLINEIKLEAEEGESVLPWKNRDQDIKNGYFLVSLRKENQNGQLIEIPSDCYLLSVPSDLISTQNGEETITIRNERIYVLNSEMKTRN